MKTARILATCVLTAVAAEGLAEEPTAVARRLLQAVDRPVGLVHLPRCGDGSLAVAIAGADENLRVHGQDADAADVAAARKAADEAGLLNRRVWIDQGSLDRLLPVGRSADLIVLIDLTTDELTPRLAAEIRRVLHPWYGVAVLGDLSGELDGKDLTEWAKQIAANVASLHGEGTLVTVQAEPLEGCRQLDALVARSGQQRGVFGHCLPTARDHAVDGEALLLDASGVADRQQRSALHALERPFAGHDSG